MIDRREFVVGAGRGGLVVACAMLLGCSDEGPHRSVNVDDWVPPTVSSEPADAVDAEVLSVTEAIVAIGRARLAAVPDEADAATLRALAGIAGDAATAPDVEVLAAGLVAAVSDDFAAGRVEHLHGWVLSSTELRVSALVALEHG